MDSRRTFIVVDDHPLYRAGVSALIQQELDLACVGEAQDAAEAQELLAKNRVDLALIDISLQKQSGLDLVHSLRATYPKLLMLVLSMHEENLYGERAIRAGARGYVMKHQPPEILVEAVREILEGKIAVSEDLKDRLFESLWSGEQGNADPVRTLTDREFAVFSLLGKGFKAAEIAEELRLAVKTVNNHQDHIKDKLGASSAAELRRYAVDWATRGAT